jgi:hypothetical protein
MSSGLNHSDWLLYSITKIMESIDAKISVSSETTPVDGKRIFIYGIDEVSIDKLYFLTNTDQNNNYLYTEDFKVYLDNNAYPFEIPGLKNIAKSMYEHSDIFAFLSGNKVHIPYCVANIIGTSYTGNTFSGYIDYLSSTVPYVENTSGHIKKYQIILNTDDPAWNAPPGKGPGGTSGNASIGYETIPTKL